MKKLAGLFTHEDRFFIHKTLGVSCLLNFLYRLTQAGSKDMAFGQDIGSLMWVLAHLMLSLTSLIFKIPVKRIRDGSRIWPEYRLHSIIFAWRSIAGLVLLWFETKFNSGPYYSISVAIVFATMAMADMVNHAYRDNHSTTVRDMDTSPFMKYFFSFSQIHGTTYCLVGLRRWTTQFVIVWVVQFTAFMMTLRRKNIFSHTTWVLIYATILSSGFAVSLYDTFVECQAWHITPLANLMVILRVNLGCPKYVLWTFCAILAHLHRTSESLEIPYMWHGLTVASTVAVAIAAQLKINKAAEVELSTEKVKEVVVATTERPADKKAGRMLTPRTNGKAELLTPPTNGKGNVDVEDKSEK
mmetsp:Transcript_90742/g.142502  ORF Transcript_90742/g.142502 Transcript_90742/m.142502 type:complete len:356 (+) Transcript_90742:80-1147(+)